MSEQVSIQNLRSCIRTIKWRVKDLITLTNTIEDQRIEHEPEAIASRLKFVSAHLSGCADTIEIEAEKVRQG